jgi:predicted dehydrogenase
MTSTSRRQFLEQTMLAAAAAAAASPTELLRGESVASGSTMERLGVAVVGVRGRGNTHLGFFAGRRDTRVLYVCDCDHQVGQSRVAQVAKRQGGSAPQFREDVRHVLDDPRVDIVTIATPHHWHALAAIWAMQAGKDVYVEKPVSHNVLEGRRMVEAARRYQRICQSGFQARSDPGTRRAIEFVQSGAIGSVRTARGVSCRRGSGGTPAGSGRVPAGVNYDLWLGPAADAPLTRSRFHHDWHWQWAYGNGDAGYQGVHQMDLCRWGLQVGHVGHRVASYGERFVSPTSADTADRQVMLHQFPDCSIVWESRGVARPSDPGGRMGVIFEGADGYVVMTGYRGATAFDRQGRERERFRGGGGEFHFTNFLHAVRRRSCQVLHADIEEGHLSSVLCHTGNISYRLGREVSRADVRGALSDMPILDSLSDRVLPDLVERTRQHQRPPHGEGPPGIRVGEVLEFDAVTETFGDSPRANRLLTRHDRYPFVASSGESL